MGGQDSPGRMEGGVHGRVYHSRQGRGASLAAQGDTEGSGLQDLRDFRTGWGTGRQQSLSVMVSRFWGGG